MYLISNRKIGFAINGVDKMDEMLLFLLGCIAFFSVIGFFTGLFATYGFRKRLERKEITWQKYRRTLARIKLMVPIGVILTLIGYYCLEINLRLIIPFSGLEIRPEIVAIVLFSYFAIGLALLSGGLAVLIYSLKKPSTD